MYKGCKSVAELKKEGMTVYINEPLFTYGSCLFPDGTPVEVIGVNFSVDSNNNFLVNNETDTYWVNNNLIFVGEPQEDAREMTLAEVCDELGYTVKIVKEEDE